jgi:F420H(2)-dependent quinone reductase
LNPLRDPILDLFLRGFSALHTYFYQHTHGRLGSKLAGIPMLLLITTGRKSGKRRVTPLGYFTHQGTIFIIASNGGRAYHPDWYLNLVASPRVEIQVKDRLIEVAARLTEEDERLELWKILVQVAPIYRRYAKQTRRQIPIIALE